jgi:hypothetical protein
VILVCLFVTGACQRTTPPPVPGPDCRALADAARRATGCDDRLPVLITAIEAAPDEAECRRGARLLLEGSPPTGAGLRSLYEPVLDPREHPLTDSERRSLAHLPLPAEVTIRPDLHPGPGVPPTTASLDSRELDTMENGLLRAHVGPGLHELHLRHAGERAEYCLRLDACDHVGLVAHGQHLAPHDAASAGPCTTATTLRTAQAPLPATDPFADAR